jgi:hypothetical protein
VEPTRSRLVKVLTTAAWAAFRAAEMKSVGDIYDKLSAFLDAVVAQQQAQEAEQAQPQGDQNA